MTMKRIAMPFLPLTALSPGTQRLKMGSSTADGEPVESANAPTQAGPVADRMTIWPMDDGRYGLDATFQGASGYKRAERHVAELQKTDARYSFRQELGGAWTIRFGPLSATEVSVALGAFIR